MDRDMTKIKMSSLSVICFGGNPCTRQCNRMGETHLGATSNQTGPISLKEAIAMEVQGLTIK